MNSEGLPDDVRDTLKCAVQCMQLNNNDQWPNMFKFLATQVLIATGGKEANKMSALLSSIQDIYAPPAPPPGYADSDKVETKDVDVATTVQPPTLPADLPLIDEFFAKYWWIKEDQPAFVGTRKRIAKSTSTSVKTALRCLLSELIMGDPMYPEHLLNILTWDKIEQDVFLRFIKIDIVRFCHMYWSSEKQIRKVTNWFSVFMEKWETLPIVVNDVSMSFKNKLVAQQVQLRGVNGNCHHIIAAGEKDDRKRKQIGHYNGEIITFSTFESIVSEYYMKVIYPMCIEAFNDHLKAVTYMDEIVTFLPLWLAVAYIPRRAGSWEGITMKMIHTAMQDPNGVIFTDNFKESEKYLFEAIPFILPKELEHRSWPLVLYLKTLRPMLCKKDKFIEAFKDTPVDKQPLLLGVRGGPMSVSTRITSAIAKVGKSSIFSKETRDTIAKYDFVKVRSTSIRSIWETEVRWKGEHKKARTDLLKDAPSQEHQKMIANAQTHSFQTSDKNYDMNELNRALVDVRYAMACTQKICAHVHERERFTLYGPTSTSKQ